MTAIDQDDGERKERLKQRAVQAFRTARLLDLPNFAYFLRGWLTTASDNRRFVAENPDFVPPPSWRMYEAYAHCSYRAYVESAVSDAQMILSMIRAHSAVLPARVLDWGCGPGRVLQQLKRLGGTDIADLQGTDYNPETVTWCRRKLTGIPVDQNGLRPPFPYDAEVFDAVYCISVFTHLSEAMHFAWIEEIRRVLKPGGILIATVHGENFRHKLLPAERTRYDRGELIIRRHMREGGQLFATFQPDSFMRDHLLASFEVLHSDPNPRPNFPQTLWVARRPIDSTASKSIGRARVS